MSSNVKPILGITLGDYNGIGPEVTLKALADPEIRKICSPLLVGSLAVAEQAASLLKLPFSLKEVDAVPESFSPDTISVLHIRKFYEPMIQLGKVTAEGGKYAGDSLTVACALCTNKLLDGIVTAPVSKKAMEKGGFVYPGQTEMLFELSRSTEVMMMLLSGTFRVGLVTGHLPLSEVPSALTVLKVLEKLSILNKSLKNDFGIESPRVAVLGLNPHAGEEGMLGSEEQTKIGGAIQLARKERIHVEGPFPADGFFGMKRQKEFDGVLAMYHDQGLIPLKMEGFETGVNFSAGLKIVRTSPDHGTAFDIAGKGIANPKSMIEAIKLAAMIAGNRKKSAPVAPRKKK
jgi:4-hydroxythreonine-4-phosphate dehydrogenase